ncbi:MAG: permease-like cell division protein FtsX [Chitinophagales bacterium]|nr:permease-like cell division protein FtsX [Chitinophagales bacterium]MDW8419402.1 permease-like cell division protein FtsX [Chitinophagales bacterium]
MRVEKRFALSGAVSMFGVQTKILARSKGTSYFYSIFGTTLVLLVMGIALLLGYEARKILRAFKENLAVEVVLHDSVTLTQVEQLQKQLERQPFTKKVTYVSKQEAARLLKKDLGEDFLEVLGYNPLYASFVLNLQENYVSTLRTDEIQQVIAGMPGVAQVNFQKNIISRLERNFSQLTLVAVVVTGILLFFAVSLIFSTIRLAIFSRRFTIKTMQLFGATKWFIIRPFLGRSLFNGFLSGILSGMLLVAVVWYFDYAIPELGLQGDLVTFALLLGGLVLFGMMISFFSTLTAVLRYLRMKVDDLY